MSVVEDGDGEGVWRGIWGSLVKLAVEIGCIDDSGVSQFGWLGSRLALLTRKQEANVAMQ
jgi:hypothetical protein